MAIGASQAQKDFDSLIERVNDNQESIQIVAPGGNAVLMSADEYASWQETAFLFRSSRNARLLIDAYEQAGTGK